MCHIAWTGLTLLHYYLLLLLTLSYCRTVARSVHFLAWIAKMVGYVRMKCGEVFTLSFNRSHQGAAAHKSRAHGLVAPVSNRLSCAAAAVDRRL